jgi:hypothetical protein
MHSPLSREALRHSHIFENRINDLRSNASDLVENTNALLAAGGRYCDPIIVIASLTARSVTIDESKMCESRSGGGPRIIEVHNALPNADGKYRSRLIADDGASRPTSSWKDGS